MILVIDNYDSFVHNLARYVRLAGAETHIIRNDAVTVGDALALAPSGVVISPGPKGPGEAGVSMDIIRALPGDTPLLGVCLGHQCLVRAFGGAVERARRPLHGLSSVLRHDGSGLFAGVASPTEIGRYHSLIATPAPDGEIAPVAWSEEGEVMAVAHRARPWFGVQFHPESLLTTEGLKMIGNFIACCKDRRGA